VFNHGVSHKGTLARWASDVDRFASALHGSVRALTGKRTGRQSAPRFKEAYFESGLIDRERYRL